MLTMIKKAAVGAALFTGLAGTSAQAASLVNGGFEDPLISVAIFSVPSSGQLTGWSVVGGNIEIIKNTYWQASEGTQSIDLNGVQAGAIQQSITGLVTGAKYSVSFDLSANPLGGANVKTVAVNAGSSTQTFTFDRNQAGYGFQNMLWATHSLMFTASGASELLRFTDVSGGGAASGPALDNVTVQRVSAPVPVPAAGLLGLSGAALLSLLRITRRKTGAA